MNPDSFVQAHVLVVDDEPQIRELLAEFLQAHGYRPSTAATPAEAIRVVQTDPPQLVISDVQLGEADGLSLVRQIKATRPALPVMLLTGVLTGTDLAAAGELSLVACVVSKTSPLQELLRALRHALESSPTAHPPSPA